MKRNDNVNEIAVLIPLAFLALAIIANALGG